VFITLNNVRLYYEDLGQGLPLVFIHGLGEKSQSWHHQVNYFQKEYRVINLDLRAHGKSANDASQIITISLFTQDVLALLEYLHIKKAVIIGHSMGGLICQELAAYYPDRVIAMALSDTAGFYPPPFCTEGLKERLAFLETATMEAMAELVAEKCCSPYVTPEVRQEIKELFLSNEIEPYRQATVATFKSDYRAYHSKMNVPTVLIVGKYDKVTPLAYAEYLQSALPSARIAVISKAAHMTKVENPKEYNAVLDEFLKEIN